jgi:hypothetical protein
MKCLVYMLEVVVEREVDVLLHQVNLGCIESLVGTELYIKLYLCVQADGLVDGVVGITRGGDKHRWA